MNYLRNRRNRFVTKIELLSAYQEDVFLISPPEGFSEQPINVEYDGVYFTLSSVSLTQKPRRISAGTIYPTTLEFSFPLFKGFGNFMLKFRDLAEIKLKLNTGEIINLNTNDISLNKPIPVDFNNDLQTIEFSTTINRIFPLDLHE